MSRTGQENFSLSKNRFLARQNGNKLFQPPDPQGLPCPVVAVEPEYSGSDDENREHTHTALSAGLPV